MRLSLHVITIVVPEEVDVHEEIYEIISHELLFHIFTDYSRARMLEATRGLEAREAEGCILGCTPHFAVSAKSRKSNGGEGIRTLKPLRAPVFETDSGFPSWSLRVRKCTSLPDLR